MLNSLISILKIVLGSLIAHYFHAPLMGGWWAGVSLMICSVTTFCSLTGYLFIVNLCFNLLCFLLSIMAVISDSLIANYFLFTIVNKCNNMKFDSASCFCASSYKDYEDIMISLPSNLSCDNVFYRNPQLLIINAVLSAICCVSSLVLCILIYTPCCCTLWMKGKPTVRDFTIEV